MDLFSNLYHLLPSPGVICTQACKLDRDLLMGGTCLSFVFPILSSAWHMLDFKGVFVELLWTQMIVSPKEEDGDILVYGNICQPQHCLYLGLGNSMQASCGVSSTLSLVYEMPGNTSSCDIAKCPLQSKIAFCGESLAYGLSGVFTNSARGWVAMLTERQERPGSWRV